jgi:hypothetical protein
MMRTVTMAERTITSALLIGSLAGTLLVPSFYFEEGVHNDWFTIILSGIFWVVAIIMAIRLFLPVGKWGRFKQLHDETLWVSCAAWAGAGVEAFRLPVNDWLLTRQLLFSIAFMVLSGGMWLVEKRLNRVLAADAERKRLAGEQA